MNTIINFVLSTVAVMGFPAVIVWMFIQATDTPDVIFSYSSKQCVRVDYPDGTHGDCSKLPKKFNHIWGE
ncbi:MAG: hypothetical protein ACSW73_00465 [Spirochaetales bacterium]